jgi:hypothetical protein
MTTINSPLIVICPHCNDPVLISEINCQIFRHGVLIESGQQIDPHSSKEVCIFLFENKKIYGCGKPFQLIKDSKNEWTAVVCEYV